MLDILKIKKLLLLFFLLTSISLAQKTDITILKNGDRITGEIKKLQNAMLTFKTDNMGTVNIEWTKIRHVISKHIFDVGMRDGRIFLGSLDTTYSKDMILVKGEKESFNLFKDSVVSINPIKSTFWDILSGSVSLGLNYTKASQTGQWNLSGTGNYRTTHYNTGVYINSIVTFQDNQQTSKKQDIAVSLRKYLPNNLLLGTLFSLEQNTELGIQLRTSLNAGGGYVFFQSNTNSLWGMTGLSVNRETFTDTTDAAFNLDGFATVQYQIFIYDDPKTSLNTYLAFFPGFTDWGRIRLNYNIDLDWEILSNFYWDLSFYFSFDNKPTSNASSTDYGITASLKFTFNQ